MKVEQKALGLKDGHWLSLGKGIEDVAADNVLVMRAVTHASEAISGTNIFS